MKINKLSVILMVILVIVLCLWTKSCSDAGRFEQIAINNNDTLTITRNAANQQEATIGILQGSISDLMKLNADKDAYLKRLQDITDKHTISSDVLSNSTSNTILSDSVLISSHDTIRKDSLIYIYPVYSTSYSNQWEKFTIDASRDNILIKYKVFNEYNIVTRNNKPAWYKMRVPEITVTNLNPNTETLVLKSFVVAPPKNQKLFIFLGGLAGGIASSIYVNYKLK